MAVLELEHGNQFPEFIDKSVSNINQRIGGDCTDICYHQNIKTSVLKYCETILNGKIPYFLSFLQLNLMTSCP